MKNHVTSKKDFRSFRIYIDDYLHIELLMENYDGMQSWLEGSSRYNYFIKFYKKIGEPMICEYDDKDIWLQILKEIDNNL